ncbi:hypothetical protein [Paenarthrobacter sp. PH39-S1]|uniref:hypothetical protein n=1 Tax=Paenarthrobacter sp. PH39-S1 TaxID=3046204 RepID=UPI0024BA4AAB|nr:hypothetical protein [Paenarthrobacter sp. PH39-S1]MDJ0357003.1 hypothetical protein [Paenarthrobacter sp. PH39-S1]
MESGENRGTDRRALRFAIIFPLLLAISFGLAGYTLRGEIPLGAVLPFGGSPLPAVGYLAFSAGCIALAGIAFGSQAARTSLPRTARRALLGTAFTAELFLTSLFGSTLVAQAGAGRHPGPQPDPIVLAMGSGAALALGVVIALVYQPAEQWTQRDEEALRVELDPALARNRLMYWVHPRSSVLIMILLAGALPGVLIALALPWLGALVLALALAAVVFLTALVDADRDGATVLIAGVVPALHCRAADVQAAAALDTRARDYGGWGLRRRGGTVSYLAASGPAVVVRLESGTAAIIGAPDTDRAEALAALLNGSFHGWEPGAGPGAPPSGSPGNL